LRGKGKRKDEWYLGFDVVDELFQSPCGEKVSGKKKAGLGEISFTEFQSPCGEKVSGKHEIRTLGVYGLLFQSPCGEKVSGK